MQHMYVRVCVFFETEVKKIAVSSVSKSTGSFKNRRRRVLNEGTLLIPYINFL